MESLRIKDQRDTMGIKNREQEEMRDLIFLNAIRERNEGVTDREKYQQTR